MRKPRVLIFDDEVTILKQLERYFSMSGYEVFSYNTPAVCPFNESSSESCENLAPCADVVISDFLMPEMTGIELLQGQSRRGCKIDIKMKAIMSGYSGEDLVTQCEDLGCNFFAKPFTSSELPLWINERRKHVDLSQQLGGPKISRRYDYKQNIVYRLNAAGSRKKFHGFTVNKSDDGLGLRVFNPLRAGQKITIINGLEVPNLDGTVIWCSKEGENAYRAGLRLLNR